MMYDSKDFFSPERVDERLELSPLLPAGYDNARERARTGPNLLLLQDLRSLYGAEETRNTRSLQHVWQRLAEPRTDAWPGAEHPSPARPQRLQLLTPRENDIRHATATARRGRRLATPGMSILAAVLFLALMVGSLLAIVHVSRPFRSSRVATGVLMSAATVLHPTPGPGYPYPAPGHDIARSPASPDGFPALAWAPNGKRLVASTRGTVWLWDLVADRYTPIFAIAKPGEKIHALAWSPDGHYLAVGSNPIQVIDPVSGQHLWSYSADYPYLAVPGQPTRTTALAWSPDSKRLAMATQHFDKRCFVNIWNVQSPLSGNSFPDIHCANGISSISWSSDARYVVSADGQSIQAWDAQSGYDIFQHAISAATSVSWSPSATNAGELAFADHGASEVWNVWTGQLVNRYPSTPNGILAWAPDGNYLATASGRAVIIYDIHSSLPVYIYTSQAHAIASLAWSPDGRYLASGEDSPDGNNIARVWSA